MTEASVALWRALQPLRSVACWLMTGAHPDDEWSGFLAWLAFGRGVRTVYACATRGEGGQNALGPERGAALGALRSREMELSAQALDLALHWLGAGPVHGADDPIHDFGFSKSGDDTLARWGEARLTDRIAALIRAEQPDAVSPTFLDVPGQHGHHRAVTRCTLAAVDRAADPGWRPSNCASPPWRVPAVFLPAFSGAGGSYDDREPPPAADVTIDLGARCAVQGVSWAQLGERARRWHASQGMGRDLPDGSRPFPLHRRAGTTLAPLDAPPADLAALADRLPAGPAADGVRRAARAIGEALAVWPAAAPVADALHRALGALDGVVLPASGAEHIAGRIALKRRQLARAAACALGIGARLALAPPVPRAGTTLRLATEVVGSARIAVRLPPGWAAGTDPDGRQAIAVPRDALPFGSLRAGYDPLGGNDPLGASLHWRHGEVATELPVDLPGRLVLAPEVDVAAAPSRLVRRLDSPTPVEIVLTGATPPVGWPVSGRDGTRLRLAPPPGLARLPAAGARLALVPGTAMGAVAVLEPAVVGVLRAEVAIDPGAVVGVVAGEADETLGWLRQLDIAAAPLDDATLTGGDLVRFSTVLVGIHGFGQRPALAAARDRLVAWIREGGSLVTLYHRPGDGWASGRTPPLPIEIGSPSLRWRVTDPAAPVVVLAPAHPLLHVPNRIDAADWEGWVRERGLYFAAAWDHAYQPLLALADPGESALHGAVLAARVGRGRHVHVALALHHQLSALVPGAFRLLANLVARPAG